VTRTEVVAVRDSRPLTAQRRAKAQSEGTVILVDNRLDLLRQEIWCRRRDAARDRSFVNVLLFVLPALFGAAAALRLLVACIDGSWPAAVVSGGALLAITSIAWVRWALLRQWSEYPGLFPRRRGRRSGPVEIPCNDSSASERKPPAP
jgi:hypothetical protein